MTVASTVLFALALLLAGLGGASLMARVFRGESDSDARADVVLGLALPAGLVLAAFPGWLLSAVGRVPLDTVVLPLALLSLLVALALFGKELLAAFPSGRAALLPAFLFVGVFLAYLWLRWPTGDIRGQEKPMDFAVLNGLMTTPAIPFEDPWMSGQRFPYYHFGTFLLALPARAARVPPEDAYNLVAALLPALAALAGFAAIRSRGGGRPLALFAALLLVLGGTPDALRQWLGGRSLSDIDFWASSRRVKDLVGGQTGECITEWPLFTFRLADLHPHAVTLPFFVALVAGAGRVASLPGVLLDVVMAAAVLSANPWDLPAVLLVLAAGNLAERAIRPAAVRAAATLLLAVPLLVPFLLAPRPRLRGITFWPPGTTVVDAFLHWGALALVPAIALGIGLIRSTSRADVALLRACLVPAVGFAAAVATRKPALGLGVGFLLGAAWLLFRANGDGTKASLPPEGALRAGFLLAASGISLVILPDVLVVTDTYGPQLLRMNTVFKTWSDAWPLLVVGGTLLLPLVLSTRHARGTIRAFLAVAAAAALVHPLGAARVRLRSDGGTLDGLRWMERDFPGDRLAVTWIRQHLKKDAVVAEATGGAYSDYGRIGVASGRPTLLGWANHEGLWRAEAGDSEIRGRQNDLKLLYLSMEIPAVLEVIHRRKIDLIVLGPLERNDFGPNAFPTRGAFRKVFDELGTALYEPTQ